MEAIPVIDLAPLRDGEAGEVRVGAEIDRACRTIGFFYIVNTGVAQGEVDRIFAAARRFFALPMAEKQAISITRSDNHRGFGAVGVEQLEDGRPGDLKESFDMARHLGPDDSKVRAGVPLHGPNQYPAGLPGWRETMEAHYARMLGLGRTVLRTMTLPLDLPRDFFDRSFGEPVSVLRLLHYPPAEQRVAADQLGAGAHTDYGCVTLLAQDDVGGLQVRSRDGGWIDAPVIPGSFVVNVGDLMQRWTNDVYVSTPHRVINPSGRERYSIPFFVEPDFDTPVSCIPSCVTPDRPCRHAPTQAGPYIMSRFDATYEYRRAEA